MRAVRAIAVCWALVALGALAASCQGGSSGGADARAADDDPAFAIDVEILVPGALADQEISLTWEDGADGETARMGLGLALRRTFATRDEALGFSGAFEVSVGGGAPSRVEVGFDDCDFVTGAGFDPTEMTQLSRRFRLGESGPEETTTWAWKPSRSCYRKVQPFFPGEPDDFRRMLFVLSAAGHLDATQDGTAMPVSGLGTSDDRYMYELHLDWPLESDPTTAESTLGISIDGVDAGEVTASFEGCLSVDAGSYDPAGLRLQQLALGMDLGTVFIDTVSGCRCVFVDGTINAFDACGTL